MTGEGVRWELGLADLCGVLSAEQQANLQCRDMLIRFDKCSFY